MIDAARPPDVSFIMPCYNEESVIAYTIPRLVKAFEQAGYRLELIACDNGSKDRTGEIIQRFVREGLPVVPHRVDVNQGYGFGVLDSIRRCSAPYVGIIPADGQVDAEDVVKVFESVSRANVPVIGKVRRRFRLDGFDRFVVSVFYNSVMLALWPGLGTLDVNGSPKLIPRAILEQMELESKDWLLDPEIMIKARHLGVPVIEMNAFSRMRESGVSHVKATTVWTFLTKLAAFKWGSKLRGWYDRHPAP
jgi:glycosyltransferase involved in cell wall biosynthesis